MSAGTSQKNNKKNKTTEGGGGGGVGRGLPVRALVGKPRLLKKKSAKMGRWKKKRFSRGEGG